MTMTETMDDEDAPHGAMRLEDGDGVIAEEATAQDIDAALAKPRDADWYLLLMRGGTDDYVEASLSEGSICVEIQEGADYLDSAAPVDEATLRSILLAFRERSAAWRDMVAWEAPRPPPAAQARAGKLPIEMIVIFGTLGVLALGVSFTGYDNWIVPVFALAFPGLIAGATLAKTREIKRSARWKKASGRITHSELTEVMHGGQKTRVPRIEYEFPIGFETHRGNRVNFAEVISGVEAKEAVARHARGSAVAVYYNPENPKESVLERELPGFLPAIWTVVAVLVVAILGISWWVLVP